MKFSISTDKQLKAEFKENSKFSQKITTFHHELIKSKKIPNLGQNRMNISIYC